MKALKPNIELAQFLDGVRRLRSRALLLDYDGTLAPFQVERNQAFPYPAVRDELQHIQNSGQTRIVVISGRSVDDVKPLLGLDPCPEVWGAHGWERLQPSGVFTQVPLSDTASVALQAAYEHISQAGLLEVCERKRTSIALHWRGQSPEQVKTIDDIARAGWLPLTTTKELALHQFDGGVELRVLGHDKGDAVRVLLAELGESAAVAYLGDDATDEDAFEAIEGAGLSVLVRKALKPTKADLWIQPPHELLKFLVAWRAACA